MLKRVAALILILVINGQALAGGIECSVEALSEALGSKSEMGCPMHAQGECDASSCCTQGKSPSGSIVSMICCEIVCGESASGSQFNFSPHTLIFASPILSYRIVDFESINSDTNSAFSVFFKSSENDLLSQESPDLFLVNSTFLI